MTQTCRHFSYIAFPDPIKANFTCRPTFTEIYVIYTFTPMYCR